MIDGVQITIAENSNGHYRGLHIVIIDPKWGTVEWARSFDTYRVCTEFDEFLDSIPKPEENYIVCIACKDDCFTNLSDKAKEWFKIMGS